MVLATAMFLPIVIFFAARAGSMVGYSAVLILAAIYPSLLTFLHLGWIEHVLVKRLQLPKLAGKFTDAMTDRQSPGVNGHIFLLRMVPGDWQVQADRPIYEKSCAWPAGTSGCSRWRGGGSELRPSGSSGSSAWSTRRRDSQPAIGFWNQVDLTAEKLPQNRSCLYRGARLLDGRLNLIQCHVQIAAFQPFPKLPV